MTGGAAGYEHTFVQGERSVNLMGHNRSVTSALNFYCKFVQMPIKNDFSSRSNIILITLTTSHRPSGQSYTHVAQTMQTLIRLLRSRFRYY